MATFHELVKQSLMEGLKVSSQNLGAGKRKGLLRGQELTSGILN